MKHRSATIAIIAALPFLLSFYSPAFAVDDPGFIIKRMVMSENIIAKEPVTISETFSAVTEKTYCFPAGVPAGDLRWTDYSYRAANLNL